MLVSAKEMLDKAKAGKYAVGQFNINNLEWTKAILLTAQENNSPVILGVSEGAGKYMCGYNTVVGMVNGMLETLKITVPVALHLDHGSYEGAKACIEAGCSTVPTIRSKRTSQRPPSSSASLMQRASPLRLRSAQSAARKTALSAAAKLQTRRNAK